MMKFLMKVLSKLYWFSFSKKEIEQTEQGLYNNILFVWSMITIDLIGILYIFNLNPFSVRKADILILLIVLGALFILFLNQKITDKLIDYLSHEKSIKSQTNLDYAANIYIVFHIILIMVLMYYMVKLY